MNGLVVDRYLILSGILEGKSIQLFISYNISRST
jgi:hypothetical protein